MASWLKQTGEGVMLDLLVQPRASRNEVVGVQGEELKVRLTSPPVDGAANKTCRAFVAKLLGVPKGDVELAAGDKSRHKRLLIRGADAAAVRSTLAPSDQA